MKSNSILRVIVALAASSSAFGLYALETGRADPRTRTFLPPARVVWTSGDAVFAFHESLVSDPLLHHENRVIPSYPVFT